MVAWDLDPERLVVRNCESAQRQLTSIELASLAALGAADPCSTEDTDDGAFVEG